MPRSIIEITGADRERFLQDLVTNDISRAKEGLVYAALLSPQGKYLADFFVLAQEGALLLDVASSHAPGLAQRLSMYRLRADVQIAEATLTVTRGLGVPAADGFADPRHTALGWRAYGTDTVEETPEEIANWSALRVANIVPETGIELTPDSYILECGFERLHGVDFRKGCYVGQEVTARMKHKTALRKGLVRVAIMGMADAGAAITADGKPVGILHTRAGDAALAYLRLDRATGTMRAGDAEVRID